jgi:hypothetical protein
VPCAAHAATLATHAAAHATAASAVMSAGAALCLSRQPNFTGILPAHVLFLLPETGDRGPDNRKREVNFCYPAGRRGVY